MKRKISKKNIEKILKYVELTSDKKEVKENTCEKENKPTKNDT